MTLSYLNQKASVKLNASGIASTSLVVPNSQYWMPTLVALAANPLQTNYLAFFLSVGVSNVYPNSDVVDFTVQGANDVTGILNGLIIPPGIAIKGQWLGSGNSTLYANQNVIMSVYGLVSDTPPTIGIIPGSPGIRFAGSSGANSSVPLFDPVSGLVSLSVSIANTSQLFAQTIQPINTGTLAVGAAYTILPAIAGVQYSLQTLNMNINNLATNVGTLQQFSGASTSPLDTWIWYATAATGDVFPPAPHDYKGAVLSTGYGLQWVNSGSAPEEWLGSLTYSQVI